MRPMMKKVAFTHCDGENVQNLVAVRRQRTVVEGQHHLVVLQRQGFGVLHGADPRMFAGIDHQRARGPERAGIARAIGRGGGDPAAMPEATCPAKARPLAVPGSRLNALPIAKTP